MSEISLGKCALSSSSQMITGEFRWAIDLEDYFHPGDRMAHPVLYINGNTVVVDTIQKKITSNWLITVLKIVSYITIIIPLIVAVFVLRKRNMTSVQTHLDMLLIVDPVRCLQKLNEQKDNLKCLGISSNRWEEAVCDWNPHTRKPEQQTAFEACVDFLVSHNLVREESLFKKAVNQHKSPACVQLLLKRKNVNAQIQGECLREAVKLNHADIAKVLCNGDMPRVAGLFFEKFKWLDESELRRQWTALFRLNSIEVVSSLMDPFIQSFQPNRRENIRRILEEVKRECMQWLPHVSQHDKPSDLALVQQAYQKNDEPTLSSIDKDRVYGLRCFNLVGQLLANYKENQNLEPKDDKYRQLPAGLNGKRTVAWFTEQIAAFRNKARQGDEAKLRTTTLQTPIPGGRYRWGYILMDESLGQNHICSSLYKGNVINSIELSRWHHGQVAQSFTWADIENQFQTVMRTNPKNKPEPFYRSLIQLVWLIGNTSPLTRGTGSVVESMWAFVHRYWNLPVPILKKEYPQFDVINISSPLETYQNVWSRYFEPPTLMAASSKKQHF